MNTGTQTQAVQDVIAERERQKLKYDPNHDDLHGPQHLTQAAIAYAEGVSAKLPWTGPGTFLNEKPQRERWVKAAALLIAAIESHDRMNAVPQHPTPTEEQCKACTGTDENPWCDHTQSHYCGRTNPALVVQP